MKRKIILHVIALLLTLAPTLWAINYTHHVIMGDVIEHESWVVDAILWYIVIGLPCVVTFGYVYLPLTVGMGIPIKPIQTLCRLTNATYWNNFYMFLICWTVLLGCIGCAIVPIRVSSEAIQLLPAIWEYVVGMYGVALYLISVATIGYVIQKCIPQPVQMQEQTFKTFY